MLQNSSDIAPKTEISGAPLNRTDLSHAVHADNCNILDNGTCTYEYPAYTWRNYSAIMYLNNDFTGGEFFFTSDKKATVVQVRFDVASGHQICRINVVQKTFSQNINLPLALNL